MMKAYEAFYSDFPMIVEIPASDISEHFHQSDRNIAIATTFDGNLDRKVNIKNLKSLSSRLRKRVGIVYADASWTINSEFEENILELQEAIVITSSNTMSFYDFVYLIQGAISEYNQTTFLAYDKEESLTKIIKNSDEVVSFSNFSLRKAQEALTQNMKNGYGGTLVFERFRHSLNWISRMGLRGVDQSNVIL